MRDPGPEPTFKAYESEEIEAKEVAGLILTLLNKGVKASEIAVLYRPDSQDRDDPRAGEADIILAKHRGGPIDTVQVAHQLLHVPRAPQRFGPAPRT